MWHSNQTGNAGEKKEKQRMKTLASRQHMQSLNRSVDPILLLAVMWWITLAGERTSALRPPWVTHYNFSLKRLSDAPPWFVHNLWCHYKLISARICPAQHARPLAVKRAQTPGIGFQILAKATLHRQLLFVQCKTLSQQKLRINKQLLYKMTFYVMYKKHQSYFQSLSRCKAEICS